MSEAKEKDIEKLDDDLLVKMLPPDMREKLEDASPENRKLIIAAAIKSVQFEGPLPPSYMLKEYEEVLPGAADRIIKMAEGQAEHRQEIEKVVIRSKSRSEFLGVIFGGSIGFLAIAGGLFLIYCGKSVEGFISIIGALASLAGVFVYGTRSEKRERAEKREQRDSIQGK